MVKTLTIYNFMKDSESIISPFEYIVKQWKEYEEQKQRRCWDECEQEDA